VTGLFDAIGFDAWGLHALIWLPLVGVGAVLLSPTARAKHVAFGSTLVVFLLSLGLWAQVRRQWHQRQRQ
jgi:NADH:ubiquinone oxidoreductase subunit 4 (subunit M)